MHCAGAAAEVVTGLGWEALFQERVAGPLGMTTFDWEGLGATTNPRPAGGGRASARDYAALLAMLLDGGAFQGTPVLSTRTVQEILADQTGGAPVVSSPLPESLGYGIGTWITTRAADGRSGTTASPGAFGAWPWIDRERGYAAMVLVRRNTDAGRAVVEAIRPLVELAVAGG